MALTDQCLATSRLDVNGTETLTSLRLPWYRSLPFSAILDPSIEIDGDSVSPGGIEFEIGHRWVRADDLATFTDVYWFIQDAVRVRMAGFRPAGADSAAVRVHLRLLLPYLLTAPGTPAVLPVVVESRVPIHYGKD